MENNQNRPDIAFGENPGKKAAPAKRKPVAAGAKRPAPRQQADKRPVKRSPEVSEQARARISEHQAMLDKALDEMDKPEPKVSHTKEEVSAGAAKAARQAAAKQRSFPVSDKPVISSERASAEREAARRPRPASKNGKNGKKKKKKKKLRFNVSIVTGLAIAIVIICSSIVLSTGAITVGMEYLGINKSEQEITFNIPEGSSNDDIAEILVKNNIIKNKKLFKVALRLNNDPVLYPGDISLAPNNSYADIIEKLAVMRESRETIELTFKEGTNLYAVSKKLEKYGVCSAEDFLFQFNTKQDYDLDSRIVHNDDAYYDMEGYFFPDTYEFYLDDSAYNVTKMLREHMQSKITDEMYAKMDEMGMDLNEVMTLASIVQAEAGTAEDMPIVASVFINRLNNPDEFPNLQSDATKNYIKKVIRKAETSTAMVDHYTNVYDTYVCFGLPAGPIGDPGMDAINAVLNHADTKYYYFCNNLDTGEAFYAETYEQHKDNLKLAGLSE